MQAEYKRENHKSYFVITDSRMTEEESALYDLGMLEENEIEGLLPISLHSFNGETEIYYDISTKQPISIIFEKKGIRKDDLEKIFRSMRQAILTLEKYLLDMERLIIDPDYIYFSVSEQKTYLLYYPFAEEDFEKSVEKFADYILEKICNDDPDTVVYAYNFYRYIKADGYDLVSVFQHMEKEENPETEVSVELKLEEETSSELEENLFLENSENGKVEQLPHTKNPEIKIICILACSLLFLCGVGCMAAFSWYYRLSFEDLLKLKETIICLICIIVACIGFIALGILDFVRLQRKRRNGLEKDVKKSCENKSVLGSDFALENDCTEVLGLSKEYNLEEESNKNDVVEASDASMYETTLLQENCYSERRILVGKIRGRTKQIDLSSFPFIIGKSKDQVDFYIEDSSISRIHARFTIYNDVVYLTDLNSTNCTLKNGVKLQPNEAVALEAEDQIQFGRIKFTYY